MSKKAFLKEAKNVKDGSQNPIEQAQIIPAGPEPIKNILTKIQAQKSIVERSLKSIIELLIELHKRQVELKEETGLTLEQYIKDKLGIAKQTFYENIKAYETSPKLYGDVNTKNLLAISRENEPELKNKLLKELKKNPDITQSEFNKVRQAYSEELETKGPNIQDAEYSLSVQKKFTEENSKLLQKIEKLCNKEI